VKNIILASQSPRRKQLLGLLYPEFAIIPSNFNEDIPFDGNPQGYAEHLSLGKAETVANSIENGLIIGADTIVVLNNQLLGKPRDFQEAVLILSTLSGNTHTVYTGISLIERESHQTIKKQSFHVATEVTFRTLSESEIHAYVETGSPMDKAGAYGIQDDWGAVFVSRINGDYYNVVGFPLQSYYEAVKADFPEYLPHVHRINSPT
jgi:septum formation protein